MNTDAKQEPAAEIPPIAANERDRVIPRPSNAGLFFIRVHPCSSVVDLSE